jgi:hypothetical protein
MYVRMYCMYVPACVCMYAYMQHACMHSHVHVCNGVGSKKQKSCHQTTRVISKRQFPTNKGKKKYQRATRWASSHSAVYFPESMANMKFANVSSIVYTLSFNCKLDRQLTFENFNLHLCTLSICRVQVFDDISGFIHTVDVVACSHGRQYTNTHNHALTYACIQ